MTVFGVIRMRTEIIQTCYSPYYCETCYSLEVDSVNVYVGINVRRSQWRQFIESAMEKEDAICEFYVGSRSGFQTRGGKNLRGFDEKKCLLNLSLEDFVYSGG